LGCLPHQSTQVGLAVPQGLAVFETSLQDRISSTDTSLSLVSPTVRGGTALSGFNCFTLDEGRTDMEYVCGTVSGTTVSSLTRGVDPVTATTTNPTVIGVLRSQCLDRRIGDRKTLEAEIAAWECQRDAAGARIKWMFTTQRARIKLLRAYPDPAKES
jgi:hypothetical protein